MIVTDPLSRIEPRQEFLASMKNLGSQFAVAKENVQRREAALTSALDRLTDSLKHTVGDAACSRLAQGNPLVQAVRNADEKVAARLALWRKSVEQYDRNTAFRKDFGDSLLVYIYGKVKAGKSSLGNYVAYGHGDPDTDAIRTAHERGIQPTFFMRDATNSADIRQKENDLHARHKFAVGSMETTSEIQGFRFPGLTWIDSPGLHSVTPENGELSKSYADAADLILYPMNSGQPGRASDLNEIASLLHGRKAFVVVISRCDEIDVDVDDEGNKVKTRLMKTPKNRQDQIDYVRQEILAKAEIFARDILDADVTTISVSYAQEHGDDPVMLRESGMSGLFEKLTTLTKAQGVALKKATPLNNLRVFVDLVLEGELSVNCLRADLLILEESIASQRDSLTSKQKEVTGRVMLELDTAIEGEVNRQRVSRDVAALSSACSKLVQEIVIRHTTKALDEVLLAAQASINAAVRFEEFKDLPEFCNLTQDITLSNVRKGRAIGGALGAVIAGIGVVLAIPTAGTSLLATAAAGAAVASVGRWVGAKAGGALAGKTTTTIDIGDNTREVIAETTRIASDVAHAAIIAAFKTLDQEFLTPVESRSRDIIAALDHFKTTLTTEVRPNEI